MNDKKPDKKPLYGFVADIDHYFMPMRKMTKAEIERIYPKYSDPVEEDDKQEHKK